MTLLIDALATVAYPGLAAMCVFWVSVAAARWVTAKRLFDFLLMWLATFAAATFVLLALSTGLAPLLAWDVMRFGVRLGWLVTLLLAIATTTEFVRQQHAIYRKQAPARGE